MCGLFGILGAAEYKIPEIRNLALSELKSRGPDASGYYLGDNCSLLLVHTQLAITDLSELSRQPFHHAATSSKLVFNGEIYNFQQLRTNLEKNGWQFESNSDTEVLLAGLVNEGPNFLRRCNGMFSLAFYDGRRNQLILARDRVGEKPLYHVKMPKGGMAFSSDSKILARMLSLSPVKRENALSYFTLGYGSTDLSLFPGVQKVAPGTYLEFNLNGQLMSTANYWKPLSGNINNINENQALEELDYLLREVCGDQAKIFDSVKGGVFLSGGIDSSLITSFLVKENKSLTTLTAKFNESQFDESDQAKVLTSNLSVAHELVNIDVPSFDDIVTIYSKFDEPIADTSAVPTYLLSKYSSNSVKFVIGGDGGDEVFGGYTTYLASNISRLPWRHVAGPLCGLANQFLTSDPRKKISFAEKITRLRYGLKYPYPISHVTWRHVFDASDHKILFSDSNAIKNFYEKQLSLFDDGEGLPAEQVFDIKTYLVENILVKSDRMSMANGLEIRSPFLDHRIIEFGLSLPNSLKIRNFQTKFILKSLLKKRTGEDRFYQKKQGFSAPIGSWMKGYSDKVMEYLCDSKIWPNSYVHRLIKEHMAGKVNHTYRLTALISFTAWSQSLR